MSFKILATADLHLGKKSSGVPRSSEQSSTQFTWRRIVHWSAKNEIDALVLAGDIVDRDNRFFEAIGPLQEGFEALQEAEIPVIMVAGNHDFDVLPDIIKNKQYDHVHLLGKKGSWQTVTIKSRGGELQFLGWSFPAQYVREDPSFQKWSAGLNPNLPTIGILHGDVHDPNSGYAPVGINHLISGLVDSWVLGHIHKPEIHRRADPLIFYPGSPHALSSKEPGTHGPVLLTVDGREVTKMEKIALSPIRYDKLEVDITGIKDESEFRNLLTGRLSDEVRSRAEEFEHVSRAIYDLILTGRHASLSELERWSQWAHQFEQELLPEAVVTIRTIVNRAEPKVDDLHQLAGQPTPPGLLAQAILDLQAGRDSEFLDRLAGKFKTELGSMNTANTYQPLCQPEEPLTAAGEDAREYLLRECRQLLGRLLAQKK